MLNLQEPKGKLLFIAGFTIIHILLTVLFFFVSFSYVMAHADDNLPLPKPGEVLLFISDILLWPLIKAFTNEIFIEVSFSPGLIVFIIFFKQPALGACSFWDCISVYPGSPKQTVFTKSIKFSRCSDCNYSPAFIRSPQRLKEQSKNMTRNHECLAVHPSLFQ